MFLKTPSNHMNKRKRTDPDTNKITKLATQLATIDDFQKA
jgi:hypothetical protein